MTKFANDCKKVLVLSPLDKLTEGTKVCRMSMSQFLILLKKLVMHRVNRMKVLILNYFMVELMTKGVICVTFKATTLNWRRKHKYIWS